MPPTGYRACRASRSSRAERRSGTARTTESGPGERALQVRGAGGLAGDLAAGGPGDGVGGDEDELVEPDAVLLRDGLPGGGVDLGQPPGGVGGPAVLLGDDDDALPLGCRYRERGELVQRDRVVCVLDAELDVVRVDVAA